MPEVLTADHLLVYVRRWQPVEFKLGPQQEVRALCFVFLNSLSSSVQMAFLKRTSIKELKEALSRLSSVPAEHIRVCKPWAWKLNDVRSAGHMCDAHHAQSLLSSPLSSPVQLENIPQLDWHEPNLT